MDVSYSRIRTWRQCTQAHEYRYTQRIRRKSKPKALFFGSAIHDALEAYHKEGSYEKILQEYKEKYDRLFTEERQALGNFLEDFPRIVKGYIRHWKRDDLEYLEVESKLTKVEIAPGVRLGGKIDAIVEDTSGKRWILERKTHSGSAPTEHERNFSIQGLIYLFLVRNSGNKVSGILWDYVRTKAPVIPEVLSSGQLSKRMNIDSDYRTYLRAIRDNELDPNNYTDILEHLRQTTSESFYRRVKHRPPEVLIEKVVDELIGDIELMGEERKSVRNFSFLCKNCEFKTLCYAEAAGLDHKFIRKNEFEENDYESRQEDQIA